MKRMVVVAVLLAVLLTAGFTALPVAGAAAAADPSAAAVGTSAVELFSGTLSPEEAAGLAYMREEEKLAHDVYLALYERWGSSTFQTIARSEQAHSDAVKVLLDRYGLADPAAGNGLGVFGNPDLQALYDTLVVQGSASLAAAYRVGAAIEEIDILDLQERLAQTDQADIQRVYQNLERGSQNHLRAFVTGLENQTGEAYAPQYLSQEAYDAIMAGQAGRSGSRGAQGQRQGRRPGRG